MKKVLLAVDGLNPGHCLMDYAVQFCRRMKSELVVLQVIDPKRCEELLKSIKKSMSKSHRFFENSIAAASLAETGHHEMARAYLKEEGKRKVEHLLSSKAKCEVKTSFEQRIGSLEKEIFDFLDTNQDVIMAMYDGPDNTSLVNKHHIASHILKEKISLELGIPLVTCTHKS
jgi:hypothetical protein